MRNVLADRRWTQRGVVCRCSWAGTTARQCRSGVNRGGGYRAGTALVTNSSSLCLYTLFYSVIYNSVVQIYYIQTVPIIRILYTHSVHCIQLLTFWPCIIIKDSTVLYNTMNIHTNMRKSNFHVNMLIMFFSCVQRNHIRSHEGGGGNAYIKPFLNSYTQ